MHPLDLSIVLGFTAWVLYDGIRHARQSRKDPHHWLLAGRRAPWWAMGLSIMATQASAITIVGTTGKGFEDGTAFVQFYYSMPLAMAIVAWCFVPFYARTKAFTAYDWIEARHGRPARTVVASVFLLQRALALGVVMSVPARVLTHHLALPYEALVFLTAGIAIVYTSVGGVAAVLSTDVKQMAVMVIGLIGLFIYAFSLLPPGIGAIELLRVADDLGQLELFDARFDPADEYNLWSSLFGAMVIFLAYFGTDQSQVQRWLAGRDQKAQRGALWLNAGAKIPLQFAILFLGVTLSLGTWSEPLPLFLTETKAKEALAAELDVERFQAEDSRLQTEAALVLQRLGQASTEALRATVSAELVQAVDAHRAFRAEVEAARREAGLTARPESNDIVPWLIRHRLPMGLAGLLLVAIFAAALSSIDSELTALSSVATIDLCRIDPNDPAQHQRLFLATRGFTVLAGVFAAAFALTLAHTRSVVEQVNAVGSWFYGALLGAFLVAMVRPRAPGAALIAGLAAGIAAVPIAQHFAPQWLGVTELPFLWRNTIGLVTSLATGFLATAILGSHRQRGEPA